MCPQKKKSSGLRSGKRGGQALLRHIRFIVRDMYASVLATRPSCLGNMLRRQVQNDVRGDDLFMLDAFGLYSFLPLSVECHPMFH
ncbi:hypothetical protein AVEN_176314-1, partial [Araneus ventricosus]